MPPQAAGVSAEAHSGSSMWCLTVASLLLTLPHTGGSLAPPEVRAVLGDDVTLPCHVSPPADAGGETEVEWSRSEPDPHWVHVRRSAVEVDQNPAYRNRTWLSAEALKRGDASLRLSKVRLADEGRYTCLLPGLEAQSSIQLVVEAAIEVSRGSAGVLHCESEGWFPQPEVRWLDGAGKLLPAGPTETLRGPGDLYAVSSRLTVEEGHGRTFTCRVQTKPDQFREARVLVPDDFFAPSSTGRTVMWASLGVILLLALVLVGLKQREDKINTKNRPKDEEAPELQDRWIRSTREDPEQQCLLGAGTDLMMGEKRILKERMELGGPSVSETEANCAQVHEHNEVQHKVQLEEEHQNQDGPEQKKAEEGAQQDNIVEPLLEARQRTEGTGGDLGHPRPPASSHRPTHQGQDLAHQPPAQDGGGLDSQQEQDQQNQDQRHRDRETQEQSSLENQDHTEQEKQDRKDQEKKKQRDQESQDHTQQRNQNQRQQDNQDQKDQENQHQKDQDSHDQRDQEKHDQRDQEGQDRGNQENQEAQMNQQDPTQTAGQAKKRRKRNRGGKNKKS